MKKTLKYLSLGLLSTILTATPGLGAERISFFFPPLGEFSLSADSLELFAKEGKINNELGFYAQRATPQQLAQLRDLLQQRFNLTPTLVSQFTYSPIGEEVVRRLGELVLTDSRQNGFFALRAALILAAADPQGLTVVNVLRKYPSNTVRLNFAEGLGIVKNLSELLKTRDAVVTFIQKEVNTGVANSTVDFSQQPDLRLPGTFGLEKINFTFNDSKRERQLPVDLYLPQVAPQSRTDAAAPPFPLIVISHGLASDRYAFVYLARHLVSHGFAVAVLEHPGSNAERFQQFFAGLAGPPDAKELINRPMDVKYVLDELQQMEKSDPKLQGKLNFQQVGAIGHSYGGYTVLSLAGAKINFQQIRRVCKPNRSLNLSVLLQCSATDLLPINYQLKDDRIKVVIAVNPFNSSIFSQSGVSQIQVPVMLVGSSQDIVTPVVPEQIIPFTWLPNPNKYLALIENATHFTAIAEPTPENNVLPVPPALLGPNPAPAYSYLRALSVAFLETHLLKRPEYRSYLQPSYAQYISKEPLNLSLTQSLTADQLAQALNGASRQSAAPAPP